MILHFVVCGLILLASLLLAVYFTYRVTRHWWINIHHTPVLLALALASGLMMGSLVFGMGVVLMLAYLNHLGPA